MPHFFTPLAEPIGALWCLMVLALVGLLWCRRWHSAFWLGIPTVLLFVIGSTSLTETLIAREEQLWATGSVPEKPSLVYDAVVALGGGQRVSQHDLLGFAMSDGGSRVLTALQLVRSGKARNLVLGGSWPMPGRPNVPSLGAVQDWAISWGLPRGNVTNLGVCINTHDEAIAFGKLSRNRGWTKVILVTSALHMRRAEALFQKQGIKVVPLAADFQVLGVPKEMSFSPFPRQGRFDLLSLYLHEKIGWVVYRTRGWI